MPKDNESTTKFKVDISELKRSMQEAQRQIRLANAEFKAASSGMDNWGKSADGLSAKIKQLETVLDGENKKLNSLKEQLKLVEREQGANSKGADELRIAIANQQAAVNKTEKALRDYKNQLSDLEKDVEDVNRELENTDEATKEAGDGFTILKGILANLAAEGIKKVTGALKDMTTELLTDSSGAYAQFAAATGTATDAMSDYEDAIDRVYKSNFGDSLEDVANKMTKVKEVTGEIDPTKLEDMTKKAITLENVFDMDITETLRGVNGLMDHFGLTSEQAFDLISSGAQNGLNYTDELGDNVSEYAGKFAEAGYTSEEYFQLLKNGADGGAYNLDKVNDAVNEVTARLADGTIEDSLGMFSGGTQDVFKAWQNGKATQKDVIASIVNDIKNTTGEQEKMNLAAKAFGTMAEDGGTQFIEALTPVGDTFTDVTGKAEELAKVKYDTPMAKLKTVGRTLKVEVLQPLADKLAPILTNIADWFIANMPNIISGVEGVVDAVKNVISFIDLISPALAGIATAIAGLALVGLIQNIGAIGLALKTWAMSTKIVTAAQWLLNAAMSANPISLIIIGIAALVAALVVLWKKSDKFREFVLGAFEKIKTVALDVWENYLQPTFQAIGDFFVELWENFLQPTLQVLGEFFVETFETICNVWEEYLKPAFETLRDLFMDIWNKYLQPALISMGKLFTDIFNAIKKVWNDVLQPVFQAIVKIFKWVWELHLKVMLTAMAVLFAAVWQGIKVAWEKVLKPTFDALVAIFKFLWDKVLKPKLESMKEKFDIVFGAIKTIWDEVLKPTFDAIGKTFKKVWEKFLKPAIENIEKAFEGMRDTIESVWNFLYDKIIKPVTNSIMSAVESLANGVVDGMNLVIDALNNLSFEVPDWVPKLGGKTFGFDIGKLDNVKLPRLEYGGILKKGQMGLLEGNGAEAVVPLENNKKWIRKTSQDLKDSLRREGLLGGGGSNSTVNNYTFNQTNNSPKPLSRLEIYRQTKNQLNFAKGV